MVVCIEQGGGGCFISHASVALTHGILSLSLSLSLSYSSPEITRTISIMVVTKDMSPPTTPTNTMA